MPKHLGRYAVRRRIGSGGFATVWLAYDEQLDSPVAIKVLADNWADHFDVRRRFVEEGRFLRRVDSPYVVSVHDAGELEDGRPYLVMTYADQGTLAERLAKGPLSGPQGIDIVRQVGLGLAALHRVHVLHRDVKPGNVLFRSDETTGEMQVRAMLGDLGLGKAMDMSSRLTMISGTPSFAAPEQARGDSLDARADQFSLGALTYLVLTGRPPYSHASLAAAASPPPPPPMGTPRRPYPPAMEKVVARALSLDREDRWPDVRTYVEALLASASGGELPGVAAAPAPRSLRDSQRTGIGARPSPVPGVATEVQSTADEVSPAATVTRSRVSPAVMLLAAVLALVLGVGAGYLVQHRFDDRRTVYGDYGGLAVSVPESWADEAATDGWRPPGEAVDFPGLSVGGADDEPGVFVGLLPGTELPTTLPVHAECARPGSTVRHDVDGHDALTASSTECPGGVMTETVVRLDDDRLLWVQVRAADGATAAEVAGSVQASGL